MSDVNSGATNYSGNSNRDKQNPDRADKKVEQVTESAATVRKKPLGRRIAENFTGADGRDVGQYVLFEVVLPRFKDLLFDVGESALRRTLFGDSSRGYSSRGSSTTQAKGYTPYGNISSSAVPKQTTQNKPPATPSDEFGEIVVATRGEADQVMDKISNLIETYSMASVSDLKATVGLTGTFTDEKFGWVTMGGTEVRRVGGSQPGYLLVFPRPIELP